MLERVGNLYQRFNLSTEENLFIFMKNEKNGKHFVEIKLYLILFYLIFINSYDFFF